jgi:hypothetical protein
MPMDTKGLLHKVQKKMMSVLKKLYASLTWAINYNMHALPRESKLIKNIWKLYPFSFTKRK